MSVACFWKAVFLASIQHNRRIVSSTLEHACSMSLRRLTLACWFCVQEVLSAPGLKLVPDIEYSEAGRGVYPDG